MTIVPERVETIFGRMRDAIAENSDITNFSEESPERAITEDAFAEEMRERQHEALAVQLASYIDYAGKTITNEDLNDLNINPEFVDLDLLNSFQRDQDLDELVAEKGITRDPGSYATGQVTFQVQNDSVVIDSGTEVRTERGSEEGSLAFLTEETVSPPAGENSISAPVIAAERGSEYNVGSGSLTYLVSPPAGVSGVTNNSSITGGEDEESNEDLRERAKQFLITTSGGGTKGGLEGAIVSSFDGLEANDVIVDEFSNATPIYADVIIDGGPSDADAREAIDKYRPVAITHNLVRPDGVTISIDMTLSGSDIQTSDVQDGLIEYLSELSIGESVIRDQVVARIITADSTVNGIDSLSINIVDEEHTYESGKSIYSLDKSPITSNTLQNVTDNSGDSYVNGTDYEEYDDTGDGSQDSIDWSIGGGTPDDGEIFYVDYEVPDDIPIGPREKSQPGEINITVN